ncbi:MAG: S-adenosylmethionine:tRNA ribosyltransferase-isomerase [Deltaproteobacteria bacterium]|nr:S-adenosylmethionine:tRNA ribosyltransferase-isomerase [Deltaproteobacteria bacterium]
MKAASAPRRASEIRILVVTQRGPAEIAPSSALPRLLAPGDLVVVNDAATLPASLYARTAAGEPIEIRLAGARGDEPAPRFTAALLGRGDHRTRTEDRPPPPPVAPGDVLAIGERLKARVLRLSPFSQRLVDLALEGPPEVAETWAELYRLGKPVQYAHVPDRLALWDVQNVWAGRPWAVEMPSAGRALDGGVVLALRARGIDVARITHAAGLSATGDPEIDRRLPLPERFEVPAETARAVARARARGGRVVAVGTSVVRALESAARLSPRGTLAPATGITDLRLSPGVPLRVADAILTGVHEADTSHYELLGAFVSAEVLEGALAMAERERMLGHELGDAWLVWSRERAASSATVAA